MPRPSSDCWQYFDLLPENQDENRKAQCRFCGHKQAALITRLRGHLIYKCRKISIILQNELRQKYNMHEHGSSEPILFQQNTVQNDTFASTSQQPDGLQSLLDWQLARAFFSANIPFDKIENPHFVEFLKCLQPDYVVPRSSQLKQLLLKKEHWDLIVWDESGLASNINHVVNYKNSTANHPAEVVNNQVSDIHQSIELEGSL